MSVLEDIHFVYKYRLEELCNVDPEMIKNIKRYTKHKDLLDSLVDITHPAGLPGYGKED